MKCKIIFWLNGYEIKICGGFFSLSMRHIITQAMPAAEFVYLYEYVFCIVF